MTDEHEYVRKLPPRQLEALVKALADVMGETMPTPNNYEEGGRFDKRMTAGRRMSSDRDFYEFPQHLREWFDGLDKDDIARLAKLMRLNSKTIEWIDAKNERELQSLDGAVEFVSSTRTAAKVLMYVTGIAVSVIGTAFVWAKGAYEWFAVMKVPPR